MKYKHKVGLGILSSYLTWHFCGADTFWLEPEPVWRSGSGSTLDKTEEILNDILYVRSNIDLLMEPVVLLKNL